MIRTPPAAVGEKNTTEPSTSTFDSRPSTFPMLSGPQVAQIVYGVVGVICAFVLYDRLMAGEWVIALWPALILVWCVYRLLDMDDRE